MKSLQWTQAMETWVNDDCKWNETLEISLQITDTEPWGKPGPGKFKINFDVFTWTHSESLGGTPWRDPKTIGHNFMKSMGWTTKDTLRSINDEIHNDKSSNQRYSPPKYNKLPMSCCDRCSCECIKKIENTILRSNSPPKARENYRMDMDSDMDQKSPKKTPHYALPQQCNRQLDPIQPTQNVSSKSKYKISPVKKLSKTSMVSGGVELVPLLAKRRDDRPISLSSTDITKYKINKSR